jgi:hypothetical protein
LSGKQSGWLYIFDVGAAAAITSSPFTHINTLRSPKLASINLHFVPKGFVTPFRAQHYKQLTA